MYSLVKMDHTYRLKTYCRAGKYSLFCTLKKKRNLDLPIDIIIDLFNKTVKPILLYGCDKEYNLNFISKRLILKSQHPPIWFIVNVELHLYI